MASPAAAVSPPQPNPDNDGEGDDIEYEEIEEEVEIEEEIEVEEEVDADEEGGLEVDTGEGEIGEDLTPAHEENQVIDMDLEDPEEYLQTGPMTLGISVSIPLNEITTAQEDVGPLKISMSSEKKELLAYGERTSGGGPMSPFCGSGKVNCAERALLVGEDYHAAFIMADASRVRDNTREANHTATEALVDIKQMSPRSNVSQVRFREPSSSAEFNRENKKIRIVCEFHAKGWCIKGSSCRFLHIKNGLNGVVKKNEPLETQASSSGFFLPQQNEENPKSTLETGKLFFPIDDTLGAFPLDGNRGSFGHNLYKDNYHYTYGNFSSSGASHDNHHISRISDFGTTLDEMINKRNGTVHTDLRSTGLPYSLSRRPLSLGSSAWKTDAIGIHNLYKTGLDFHASVSPSLKQNISPAPCYELECLGNRVCKDVQSDIKSNNKLSSDFWEPSVPFRPSHAITQNLLMKENLYDPIGVVSHKDVKDGRVNFSHSDQGSSIKNVNNVQSNSSLEGGRLLDTVKDNKLKLEEKRSHKAVAKVNGSGKHEGTDGHGLNESKALKYFQTALVEFVKELVRPTWNEGLLSREAHKVIVKKAVDKVISTLQPQQIPCTDESIKSYLSLSLPKLEKLVEAYIDKYGKT